MGVHSTVPQSETAGGVKISKPPSAPLLQTATQYVTLRMQLAAHLVSHIRRVTICAQPKLCDMIPRSNRDELLLGVAAPDRWQRFADKMSACRAWGIQDYQY